MFLCETRDTDQNQRINRWQNDAKPFTKRWRTLVIVWSSSNGLLIEYVFGSWRCFANIPWICKNVKRLKGGFSIFYQRYESSVQVFSGKQREKHGWQNAAKPLVKRSWSARITSNKTCGLFAFSSQNHDWNIRNLSAEPRSLLLSDRPRAGYGPMQDTAQLRIRILNSKP